MTGLLSSSSSSNIIILSQDFLSQLTLQLVLLGNGGGSGNRKGRPLAHLLKILADWLLLFMIFWQESIKQLREALSKQASASAASGIACQRRCDWPDSAVYSH
jgi:hypothetical protein